MRQIYLHGLGQTSVSWGKVIARVEFAENSVCPDLTELCQGKQATYQNLYEGFSRVCSEVDGPVDLCGLSLGGVLALHYTIEHPDRVNSLVLIATQYKMPKGLLRIQNVLFHFMPRAMFQQTGFGEKEFIQLCKTMMELDFSGLIQEVSCPTLIVCGERDPANKKASTELASILENADLQIIRNSGHEVNIEAPERLAQALCAFYERVQ